MVLCCLAKTNDKKKKKKKKNIIATSLKTAVILAKYLVKTRTLFRERINLTIYGSLLIETKYLYIINFCFGLFCRVTFQKEEVVIL